MKTEPRSTNRFDTHSIIKNLIKAGIKEPQAEAIVNAINDRQDHDAATKLDLLKVKNELDNKISDVEKRLSVEIEKSKNEIIKWNVATIIAVVSIMMAFIKFFVK